MVKIRFRFLFLFLFLLKFSSLCPMHNSSKYFPFLEKPVIYVRSEFKKMGTLYPALFFTSASGAFGPDKNRVGIHELTGKYDLKDVIDSLGNVEVLLRGNTFINPFITEGSAGASRFVDKSIKFEVDGKVKSVGVMLKYEHDLPQTGLTLGAFLPFMHVTSNQAFVINESESRIGFTINPSEKEQIDRVRRSVHEALGLAGPDFVKSGFGDLDLFIRWHTTWEYLRFMRSINFSVQGGFLIPTGKEKVANWPSSVPFMGDGYGGVYLDVCEEFELKQDWRLGFSFGFLHQLKKRKKSRMPVGSEPLLFGAIEDLMEVEPGFTFKFSPYFNFGNLTDGFSVQLRYTYLRHDDDSFFDMRPASEKNKLATNLVQAENRSLWRINFFTFQLCYDSHEAMKNWTLNPKIYAIYDFPFEYLGGRNAPKHHQFTLGVELNF